MSRDKTGCQRLNADGITLIAADSPDCFTDETPTAVLIRKILVAVAQFDKSMTVAELRAARDKKRAKYGKCEGRKTYQEKNPEVVALAKELNSQRLSLRKIPAELASRGHVTSKGKPYVASAVRSMLGQ